jgi:VWFA-related protein
VTEFIGRTIGPTDLFGVVTPYEPDPVSQLVFVRRTDTLESDLTRWSQEWVAVTRPTPTEFQLTTCSAWMENPKQALAIADELVRLSREASMARSLDDLMRYLGRVRDERKNVVLISEGWVPHARPLIDVTAAIKPMAAPRLGATPGTGRLGIGAPQPGTADHDWCNQQIGQLASIDFEERLKELLRLANQANVSFYPVDVGGLRVANPMRGTVPTLRMLAENTDGVAIVGANDLQAAFRRIADDLTGYYLLGYSSTNPALDGKYRQITVKLKEPGVSVTARRGYLAPTLEARNAAVASAAMAGAISPDIADELARLSRLRADSDLFGYGTKTPTGLDVVVEIAASIAGRSEWLHGADVHAAIAAAGAPIAASGKIEAGARAVVLHVPAPTSDRGPWHVSLRAASGSAVLDGQIEIEERANATSLLGEPVAYRGTASARIPARPVADFQFRRAERMHVEWPVRAPVDQRVARVLDRRGQPLALNVALTQPDPTTLAADLLLAPLAEGDYLIELTAGANGKTEQHLVAFRVVR